MQLSLAIVAPARGAMWISPTEIAALPKNGSAWNAMLAEAERDAGTADLADKDDRTNVRVLAKALVYAATGDDRYARDVESTIVGIVEAEPYQGRALALGRELMAYVVAADLIDLSRRDADLDRRFRAELSELRTAPTSNGPANLIECHEKRANNWGPHCGATRVAIALYLNDDADLARAAAVFKGWLGDRESYAGFRFGATSWQGNPAEPVGINPKGAVIDGHDVDGVLADDQRRAGVFVWPPPREGYVYEALQGALAQALLLSRAGYDVWSWEDRALLRAFEWLYTEQFGTGKAFVAKDDDEWQPHVVNHFYGTSFSASTPAEPGKNVGWTDWTLAPPTDGPCSAMLPTLRAAMGQGPCTVTTCDADGDGKVTVSDALAFLRACVGLG